MSQFWLGVTSGNLPPSVLEEVDTQMGNAVPSNHILLLNGYESAENNPNGITTKGGTASGNPPGSGATNEADVYLTNRASGKITTVGFSSGIPITLALGPIVATNAVFTFDIVVAGLATAGAGVPLGCGFTIVGSVRTTGSAAVLIQDQAVDQFIENALTGVEANLNVNAISNDALVTVTGIAGYTIDWNATLTYTLVT